MPICSVQDKKAKALTVFDEAVSVFDVVDPINSRRGENVRRHG
jgi:hypothetical protein